MTGTALGPGGPATHYEFFAGLQTAGVAFLVTGATALVLHGVPRLTPDLDLVIDPDPKNLERLQRALAGWGYGETSAVETPARGTAIRRFAHPRAALDQIDLVVVRAEEWLRLRAHATPVALVDLAIPLVGAADLRALKEQAQTAAGREDAVGLGVLASVLAGEQGEASDTRREQIRKFSRWSVAARLDWLLASARLSKGLAPEAKPMTRGLTRRRGWYGR